LVFDDDGNAHQLYELEDEDDFKARGAAEEQRQQFVKEEAERVKRADLDDKALAKDKKRAKKEKRRERERAEAEGDDVDDNGDGGEGVQFGGGDEDALANFINDARGSSGDESDGGVDLHEDDDEEEEQPAKKQKKWFQEEGRRKKDLSGGDREIETLDDLEAEAARLLG
jgi:ATP-dependent RNA helicase DDX10/DBP4